MIDYKLPIRFYQVGETHFDDSHVHTMVARTNSKLHTVGIRIETVSIERTGTKSQSYVSFNGKRAELESLLTSNGYQRGVSDKILRVFLVKIDLDGCYGSWTYDPDTNENLQAAVFITEQFNDNSDDAYAAQGYPKDCDTLLHELGHSLMWEADHVHGASPNFFHDDAQLLDDTITVHQRTRLRGEDQGRPNSVPNYLRRYP